jgi:hypothetical protein
VFRKNALDTQYKNDGENFVTLSKARLRGLIWNRPAIQFVGYFLVGEILIYF